MPSSTSSSVMARYCELLGADESELLNTRAECPGKPVQDPMLIG